MRSANGMSYSKARSLSYPKNEIVDSLDRHLHECNKFVGSVFDKMMQGLTTKRIVSELGYHENQYNTVYAFEKVVLAMRGEIPVKRLNKYAKEQMDYALNMLIKRSDDEELTLYLEAKLSELKGGSDSKAKLMLAKSKAVANSNSDQRSLLDSSTENRPGVYVYSYPKYIASGEASADGRTFYKIGSSKAGVAGRIKNQNRSTPMPEDIVTLRVFYCDQPDKVEKQFHDILKIAGMHHLSKTGGIEWFVTDLAFIDAIAIALRVEPSPRGSV